MAVTDEERLVVALEARIRDFEKNMLKAERTGTRSYQQLAAGSTRATRQMEADMNRSTSRINQALASTRMEIGSFGRAFGGAAVGAAAAAAAIAGAIATVRNVARGFAEVSDQARIAGVSLKSFQELKFVAEQNRIGVDALTDGLKELNLRADEFIATGGGSAAESFKRLGYNATQLRDKLKDPSALFTEIIGKLGEFQKASRIRIADEIFGGTGGERFVQLIDQGEAGLRRTIDEANRLGIVLDDDVIRRAEEIDRQFNIVAATVGTKLKGAIVVATAALIEFIDSFREFENQQTRTLEGQQQSLGMRRIEIENEILELKQKQREETEALSDVARDLGFDQSQNASVSTYADEIDRLNTEMSTLAEQEKQVVDVLAERRKLMAGDETRREATTLKEIEVNAGKAAGGMKRLSQAAREAEREFERFRSTADQLVGVIFPAEAARLEAEEMQRLLDRYGDKLTEIQKKAVELKIADSLRVANGEMSRLGKTGVEAANEIGEAFSSAFADLFTEPGKDMNDFFDSMMRNMARVGSQNIENGLNNLLSGKGLPDFEKAVREGSEAGTAAGAETGLGGALQGLFTGKSGAALNAGIGGFAMGYSSQSPITGGLGGALSGAMSGAPLGPAGIVGGAIVGALAGRMGAIFQSKGKTR